MNYLEMGLKMENNKYTFWKLLDENKIEIPIIQRDYAQGRKEENRIRERFLDVLCNKIKNENETVNLDFVYGRIIDNKLIPLDGQQRLTTLFLLHWYLAIKENKLDEQFSQKLQKFTYETRISSREFCKSLSANKINLKEINNSPEDNKKISALIEDKNWFFQSWKKDPTITSMLNMIDAIHEKFKDSEDLFDKLICDKNPPITFDFLPLDDFNLTDELYIKMNARGKHLTEFEYFKAEFEQYIKDIRINKKLDNKWTDLFWKYKDRYDNYIDDRYLDFFKNITLSFYLEKHEFEKGTKVDKVNIFDILAKVYNINDNTNVTRLECLLDCICDSQDQDIKELFKVYIGYKEEDYTVNDNIKDSTLSYWDRARFYAIALFLIENNNNRDAYKKWKRVAFNLINNTRFESIDHFRSSTLSLKKLSGKIDNIYDYLDSDECSIDFFLQEQTEEEEKKVSLIKTSKDWKEAILQAENHWYFDGQIGFILDMAKDDSDYDLEKFNDYFEKLEKIFSNVDDGILKKAGFLFHRALLAKGDYLVEKGYNFTFCSNESALRAKIENWRKVFNDDDKRIILKQLLDELDTNDIEKSLETIIESFNEKDDWRYYFIKDKEIIKYCGRLQIRWYDENNILLLEKEQTNGYHAEYYTYALYLKLYEIDKNINYKRQNSVDEIKYIDYYGSHIEWDINKAKYLYDENEYTYDQMVKKINNDKCDSQA